MIWVGTDALIAQRTQLSGVYAASTTSVYRCCFVVFYGFRLTDHTSAEIAVIKAAMATIAGGSSINMEPPNRLKAMFSICS